jgi:hypothetical protein
LAPISYCSPTSTRRSASSDRLSLAAPGSSLLPWIVAAVVLYLAVFVITIAVHVPLNDDIKAAGDPDGIADLSAVRGAFHEPRWIAWNVVRTIASTVAFGCLAWALVLHGRTTPVDKRADPAGRPRRDPAGGLRRAHTGITNLDCQSHRAGHAAREVRD